ncbi:MAG TPA: DUF1569 domain-containing protein [Phycisphaerales bacterium]|nr:DUF1569 domain-containing protein [Phycisphaerales bacterium]
MAVDTKKAERRALRFEDYDAVRRELDALEAAHLAGTLRATGNWTPGQVCAHLAFFMNAALDGYPRELSGPPAFVRVLLKLAKNRYLRKGLPVGVRIPRVPGGTVGAEAVGFEEGLSRLRAACARLERHAPTRPNPVFGPMTHEEWKAINLRHCELHLGFVHPGM